MELQDLYTSHGLGFVAKLALPEADKARLLAMTPASYTGLAAALARGV